MRYMGPKHVLVNQTNNCMTEVIDWATHESSVRWQTCLGENDELKVTENLWEKDGQCKKTVPQMKRRIQDIEMNGLHRIYCFPFNITIGEETKQCPCLAKPRRFWHKIKNHSDFLVLLVNVLPNGLEILDNPSLYLVSNVSMVYEEFHVFLLAFNGVFQ